ncbi:MAG: NAD(P)-binding domain-containing protein, partial [Acidimicrobiia bacterium]
MAELDKPYPPGNYSVVVVGSGPGGLQTSYFLGKRGIDHAVISRDSSAGGMFQKFPFFDRLITWTKPHAKVPRGSREYEWYDWNSLLVEDRKDWVSVAEFMDGTSEFPSRAEMEQSLVAFAERADVKVRYECAWTGTRLEDDGFVIETTDGEYRCKVAIFAVGMTEPWRPSEIPGIEDVPHYMEIRPAKEYEGKKIYILGKANSAFEIADGLLPWASQMILTSPRPARISILTHSTAGARARYMQPYEDHALAGGSVSVLDATTEKIDKTGSGYKVWAKGTTREGDFVFDVDEAIVATGVST